MVIDKLEYAVEAAVRTVPIDLVQSHQPIGWIASPFRYEFNSPEARHTIIAMLVGNHETAGGQNEPEQIERDGPSGFCFLQGRKIRCQGLFKLAAKKLKFILHIVVL